MKKLNETYLYKKMPDYGKDIHGFIINGNRIDKTNESISDIKYEVKRKNVDYTLTKLLDSNRVVLVIPQKPLPKSLKIFTCKDIKTDKKTKVFIDCFGCIEPSGSGYKFTNNVSAVNIFISYLVAARTSFIWEVEPRRFLTNTNLIQSSTKTFAALVNYVIDYIGKININTDLRNKSLYLASFYYQVNMLGKDVDDKSVRTIAIKTSGVPETQANILELDFEKDSFKDIENFIKLAANSLRIKGLTIDTFIEKWMFLYSPNTIFAIELFEYFAQMITDTYIGAYINNQKTIEKVTKQNMVEFSKILINIGSDS